MRADLVRNVCIAVLAAAGGAIDALAYLRLHLFIANMTGNTIFAGLAIGGWHGRDALDGALAILAFFLGAFAGTATGARASDDDPWPARVVLTLAVEVAVLVAEAILWSLADATRPLLLGLGAFALGMQSAATRDVHRGGASSTYMTGTVARTGIFLEQSIRHGFQGPLALNGGIWIVYLGAAAVVGLVTTRDPAASTAVPWVVTALVALVAIAARPLVLAAKRASSPTGS